ncbi:MAG: hypothetical protein V9E91_00760 [Burkholderiaceae bacterium]
MQRDGVSLQDLLTLPTEELFQNTVFKLADLIVSQQESLSPTGKRAAYEQYALLIATKFSGDWNGHTSSGYGAKTNQEREPSRRKLPRSTSDGARRRRMGGTHQVTSPAAVLDMMKIQLNQKKTRLSGKTLKLQRAITLISLNSANTTFLFHQQAFSQRYKSYLVEVQSHGMHCVNLAQRFVCLRQACFGVWAFLAWC